MGTELLTSRTRVLLCIARNPTISYDEISEEAEVGRRGVPRVVRDLVDAGYVSRERPNRRNRYTVHMDAPLADKTIHATVGALLRALGTPVAP
jgi:DNA-binding MarR family transcriptional regulator